MPLPPTWSVLLRAARQEPGLPCPLVPTPPPPAARLPRGSSAQGARGGGPDGPPAPLTPSRPRAFSLNRQRRAHHAFMATSLAGFPLFQEESVSCGCPESRGAGVGGALRGNPSLLSIHPVHRSSLLIPMTTTQLVVNKCQLTHG